MAQPALIAPEVDRQKWASSLSVLTKRWIFTLTERTQSPMLRPLSSALGTRDSHRKPLATPMSRRGSSFRYGGLSLAVAIRSTSIFNCDNFASSRHERPPLHEPCESERRRNCNGHLRFQNLDCRTQRPLTTKDLALHKVCNSESRRGSNGQLRFQNIVYGTHPLPHFFCWDSLGRIRGLIVEHNIRR